MQFSRRQVIIIFVLAIIVIAALLMFLGIIPGLQKSPTQVYKANLNIWLIGSNTSAYSGAFQMYKTSYPGITVSLKTFATLEDYKRKLLDALAAGQGPDIFIIPNTDFYQFENKIAPLSSKQLSLLQLRSYFPQTVEREFIGSDGVYGLPVSMDSLALLYNRDFLDQEGIVAPPATWDDFQADAEKLTKRDLSGEITRYGAAIGGGEQSVIHATDILSNILLQSGVSMTDSRLQQATFATQKGGEVLSFYTHFAKPGNSGQVWDATLANSIDAFSSEKVAMIFAYYRDIASIKRKNPYLNFGVAGMPQLKGTEKVVTYPQYSVFTVSKQSKVSTAAWSFVLTLTLYPQSVFPYLNVTKEPPALRPVLPRFAEDPVLNVYARQVLTSQSWPQVDPDGVREAFDAAITGVVKNGERVSDALSRAQTTITSQMQYRLR